MGVGKPVPVLAKICWKTFQSQRVLQSSGRTELRCWHVAVQRFYHASPALSTLIGVHWDTLIHLTYPWLWGLPGTRKCNFLYDQGIGSGPERHQGCIRPQAIEQQALAREAIPDLYKIFTDSKLKDLLALRYKALAR